MCINHRSDNMYALRNNQVMIVKNCCICDSNNVPYKCPTCRKPYCSVACCKQHKSQLCEPFEESKKLEEHRNKVEYEFPTEDTVSPEKLQQLRHSKELKLCLKNPHVRQIMKSILDSENPSKAIALAMREPIFVEMADACLKIVEPQDNE